MEKTQKSGDPSSYDLGKTTDDIENLEEEDVEGNVSSIAQAVINFRCFFYKTVHRNRQTFKRLLKICFFLAFCAYLAVCFHHRFGDKESLTLLVVSCVITALYVASVLSKRYGPKISRCFSSCIGDLKPSTKKIIYWTFFSLILTPLILYVIIDTALKKPRNLVSGFGVLVFIGVMFVFSKHPAKVRWRTVVWGVLLQFVFGLLVLRTRWGYLSFEWLATKVTEYLKHTDAGSSFVFGKGFGEHFFAFSVMSTIVVFSTTINILYYLGIMQVLIDNITRVLRISLDTGPMETIHAAFNIFVGWAETIPVVKPLMQHMTSSELHAIMTNGFATVSGGTMAAYILYGAPANHLIAASFMSAPAALAMGKLFYPETVRGRRKQKAPVISRSDNGLIEAASTGAVNAIPVIAYILVHVIAFLSLLDFVNDTMAWLGARAGIGPPTHPVLSFQYISSYVMWPVAFLMGVHLEDCRQVARMLGVKVFVNEFLAFSDLGQVRKNNVVLMNYTSFYPNGTWYWTQTDNVVLNNTGQVLIGGVMSERSATIATYGLCGFSDLVALGVMIGALSAVASERKADIIQVAPRALISGVMACFLTAAMAGLLVE